MVFAGFPFQPYHNTKEGKAKMEDQSPPPYAASPIDDPQEDPIVDPTIYVLAGQSVYAETPNSGPAYELSRGRNVFRRPDGQASPSPPLRPPPDSEAAAPRPLSLAARL
ncbi:hypothetical protein NLG97_g10402 [Lecanicillium saksenae]|uniref:Uncharacterized protein n=1 Tax=Lecanicillium saksenae TaxID=468837 RepID=A0ACC1QD99_9HYPO|nr:hypothetical protein NLG97_g10402 [Lecanicillium saksenae]